MNTEEYDNESAEANAIGTDMAYELDALRRRLAVLQTSHDNLLRRLKVMVREWIEIVGDEDTNGTPGDVLEKAKAAIAEAERTNTNGGA